MMSLFNFFKKNKNDELMERDLRWNKFIDEICMEGLDNFDRLNSVQKNAVLCFWYDSEMNSGGHSGYFDCYGEVNYDELYDAINIVGNKEIADNFKEALKNGDKDDYEKTDNNYYEFEPTFDKYIMEYVENNKEEIFK